MFFSVECHGNITMGCWELNLNLSLRAEAFTSNDLIPRTRTTNP